MLTTAAPTQVKPKTPFVMKSQDRAALDDIENVSPLLGKPRKRTPCIAKI